MFCPNPSCTMIIPHDEEKTAHIKDCILCGTRLVDSVDDLFLNGKYGIFREKRKGQYRLAKDIEKLLLVKPREQPVTTRLLAEGGTGIGKSFAYLIPAIINSNAQRVIIATSNKALQAQIYEKDIPYLKEKLPTNLRFTLYKGKGNYACWKLDEGVPIPDREQFYKLRNEAMKEERPFDVADWPGASPPWWNKICAENCVEPKKCPFYGKCHTNPKDYDVIITNHHLVSIDLQLKRGTLLGDYKTLILDEAHKFEDAYISMSKVRIGLYTFKGIIRQANATILRNIPSLNLSEAYSELKETVQTLDIPFNALLKYAKDTCHPNTHVVPPFEDNQAMADVENYLETLAGCRTNISTCVANLLKYREKEAAESRSEYVTGDYSDDVEIHAAIAALKTLDRKILRVVSFMHHVKNCLQKTESVANRVVLFIAPDELKDKEAENNPLGVLETTLLFGGPSIQKTMAGIPRVVALSATLAQGDDFSIAEENLGYLGAPDTLVTAKYQSPFAYREQGLLYVPKDFPKPVHGEGDKRKSWVKAMAAKIIDLSHLTRGRTLVLFSSTKDMNEIFEICAGSTSLKFIKQDGSANYAATQYLNAKNAVLFGLKSFWEGVDYPREKLTQVIITKLPYPNPSSPVIAAKIDYIEKNMQDSWSKLSIPMMINDVRQGAGRLIRTQEDVGLLSILDPRLWTAGVMGNHERLLLRTTRIKGKRVEHNFLLTGKKLTKSLGFDYTPDFSEAINFVNTVVNVRYPA